MTTNQQSMNWNDPSVLDYEKTIRRKIAGYPLLYEMSSRLMKAGLTGSEDVRLLIVGAGGGEELITMGTYEESWHFTAIDSSENMLNLAKARTDRAKMEKRIRFIRTEVESFPETNRYEGATCLLVLHFVKGIENKRRFLKRLASFLPDHAPFCIALINGDPSGHAFTIQMEAWKQHMISQGIAKEQFDQFAESVGESTDIITEDKLMSLLDECGFEEMSNYFSSYLINAYICFKKVENRGAPNGE